MGLSTGIGRSRLVPALAVALGMAAGVRGAITVTGAVSVEGGVLQLSVSGSELPPVGSIRVVVGYDASKVAVTDALVSSPVPRIAIGAMIDTSAKTLELSVVAAGTVALADGRTFVVVQIPLTGDPGGDAGVSIQDAIVIDSDGVQHNATPRTATGHRFLPRPRAVPYAARPGTDPGAAWSLRGRRMRAGARARAATVSVLGPASGGVAVARIRP